MLAPRGCPVNRLPGTINPRRAGTTEHVLYRNH